MNRARTLSLKKETLAELSGDDLLAVAAGASVSACATDLLTVEPSTRLCPSGHTCIDCLTRWC